MPGRKRILDETKQREVCALISAGCGIEDAARYVCCTPITIRRELLRNPAFHEQLRQAQISAQLTPLQAMRKAAGSNWRAAAWLLERTQPNRFSRRNPLLYTEKQVFALIRQMTQYVNKEVHDAAALGRLKDRFGELERKLTFESCAANSTFAQVRTAYPRQARDGRHESNARPDADANTATAQEPDGPALITRSRQNETD